MEDTKERDSIQKGSGLRKGHETRPGPANEPIALPLPIPWPMEHKKDRSSIKNVRFAVRKQTCRQQDGRHGDGGRHMEMDGKRLMEHKERTGAA